MKRHSFNLEMFELAAQRAAAIPIVPVDDPNPRYPLDMSTGKIERAIRVSAEHFGHPVPVEISEGAARRLRELVEAPEPPVVMATTAEEAAQALDVLSRQMDEPPTFGAPVKGRIVRQASGPNRQQRRARR